MNTEIHEGRKLKIYYKHYFLKSLNKLLYVIT